MLKTLPVAAFVGVISFSPAYAGAECTDAHMKQMDDMIATHMTPPRKRRRQCISRTCPRPR